MSEFQLSRSEIVNLRNMWSEAVKHRAGLIHNWAEGVRKPAEIRAALADMSRMLDNVELYEAALNTKEEPPHD